MSVRITEPAVTHEADGPRRRSIMAQVGDKARMLEVEWHANRYEFTEFISFDGNWSKGVRQAKTAQNWQGVIAFVAGWSADTIRAML